ncbi:zinc-ribbon domain-containing protein [Streptococcus ovuberis]
MTAYLKILKGFNSFDVKYPHLMKEWDYLNNVLLLNPSEISESNTKSVWWICQNDSNHHYKMSIYKRIQCEKRSKEPCSICKGRRRKREHFLPFK